MFDLLGTGVNREDVSQALRENFGAIALALLDKGVLTLEELDQYRAQAVHEAEQLRAKEREDLHAAARKEFPVLAEVLIRGMEDTDV